MQHSETKGIRQALFAFLFLVLLLPAISFAQENPMDVFVDGVEAYETGKYRDAEAHFSKAISLDSENNEFRYYLGLTNVQLNRQDTALSIFSDLVTKDPENYRKAYFDIAAIYSGKKQYKKALQALEEAIQIDQLDARGYMEAGIVQRNLKQYDSAINNFNTAKMLDPKMAQAAEHMVAVIYMDMEDYSKAEEVFRSTAAMDPQSPVADSANKSLESVNRIRKARKPWFINGVFSYGYDDNVTAEPLDSRPGDYLLDKADTFETLVISGGYRLLNEKENRIGIGYTFNTIGYQDLYQSNVLSHNPYLFGEADRGIFHFRAQYDFAYYYAGGGDRGDMRNIGWYITLDSGEDTLSTNRLMASVGIDEPYGLHTDFSVFWMKKDYGQQTPDTNSWNGTLIQSYRIPDTELVTRLGYTLYKEDATVSDYSYYYHQFLGGVSFPIYWEVRGDLGYTFSRTHYEEHPPFWNGDRKDTGHLITITLFRNITDDWQIIASYTHNRNDSNLVRSRTDGSQFDDYEYRKNVYSLAVSAAF